MMKHLRGMKLKNENLVNQMNIEKFPSLSLQEQANAINTAFLEPLEDYRSPIVSTQPLLEEWSELLTVTEARIYMAAAKLNPAKASGPDNVPNWFLKKCSDFVVHPITQILNASYREQYVPVDSKMADVIPLPKKKSEHDLNKDLRPISLTPCISNLAEEFVVNDYIKPAVLKVIDPNQCGAIPKSSTTMALISTLHCWILGTDGNGSTIRTFLLDYRKAFDFIDHNILIDKIRKLDLPRSIVNWITNFPTNRLQRLKLSIGCYSEWGFVPCGVPQGTKLGPWYFILMINDLSITEPYLWKFVNDTTVSEIVRKGSISKVRDIVDQVTQ